VLSLERIYFVWLLAVCYLSLYHGTNPLLLLGNGIRICHLLSQKQLPVGSEHYELFEDAPKNLYINCAY